jgi:iron complex outermembrane receptor protein
MKKILFLMLLVAAQFYAFSQLRISGKVTDAETGEGLPWAHVVIQDYFSNAISAQDGHFEIKGLKEAKYTLKTSFIGYETDIREVDLQGDTEIIIPLQPQAILEDEVVITATRAHRSSPKTYEIVTREKLRERNLGKDLPVLLESTPGAVVTSDAGAGIGYTGIRIRGTDITRINVTVNGIPLNDPESQGVFWVNMPDFATSVDNIQVQRGVGTSTNGAAAFGASINIKTQGLRSDPYAELNSSAGSFNTLKNSLTFGTGLINGRFTIDGRLSKITSDGYIDRASSDLKSFYVSGGYYGVNSILKLNVFSGQEKTYQAWYGVPGDSLKTNRTYNPAGEYVDDEGNIRYYDNQTDNYQQDHYQLIFSQRINRNLNLNTALFYVRGYGYYESYYANEDFTDYGLDDVIIGMDTITNTDLIRRKYLDNDFYGITVSGNYNSLQRLTASFGGSWNYYEGGHYGTVIWSEYASNGSINRRWYDNTGTKMQYNVFGKVNYQFTKALNVYADLQFRGIKYEIEGTHDDLRDISQEHDFSFFNPKFGALYDFNENNQAYFSFAVANREPTRSDFRDADEGHQPKPEKLYNYELGYNYIMQKLRVNANLFYMDYTDQLVLTGEINNVGAPIFTNVAESYRVGLELVLGWKISNAVAWEGNASFSRNKIRDFESYVDNWSPPFEQINTNLGETDLSFSPEVIANSIFTFMPIKDLNVKLVSKYVGKQYIDNTSSDDRSLDPYFVNDILINYSFDPGFVESIGLFLNVSNVLNEKYETNAWVYRYNYEGEEYMMNGYFPQATINFLAGVSLKL